MAYSHTTYTSDGVTQQYILPFGFLDGSHISIEGFETGFSAYPDTGVLYLDEVPPLGTAFTVRRTTPVGDFSSGAAKGNIFNSTILDNTYKNILYISQELDDKGIDPNLTYPTGDLDMHFRRITDVKQPVVADDMLRLTDIENFKGVKGPQGDIGEQGIQGIQGLQGEVGGLAKVTVGSKLDYRDQPTGFMLEVKDEKKPYYYSKDFPLVEGFNTLQLENGDLINKGMITVVIGGLTLHPDDYSVSRGQVLVNSPKEGLTATVYIDRSFQSVHTVCAKESDAEDDWSDYVIYNDPSIYAPPKPPQEPPEGLYIKVTPISCFDSEGEEFALEGYSFSNHLPTVKGPTVNLQGTINVNKIRVFNRNVFITQWYNSTNGRNVSGFSVFPPLYGDYKDYQNDIDHERLNQVVAYFTDVTGTRTVKYIASCRKDTEANNVYGEANGDFICTERNPPLEGYLYFVNEYYEDKGYYRPTKSIPRALEHEHEDPSRPFAQSVYFDEYQIANLGKRGTSEAIADWGTKSDGTLFDHNCFGDPNYPDSEIFKPWTNGFDMFKLPFLWGEYQVRQAYVNNQLQIVEKIEMCNYDCYIEFASRGVILRTDPFANQNSYANAYDMSFGFGNNGTIGAFAVPPIDETEDVKTVGEYNEKPIFTSKGEGFDFMVNSVVTGGTTYSPTTWRSHWAFPSFLSSNTQDTIVEERQWYDETREEWRPCVDYALTVWATGCKLTMEPLNKGIGSILNN